MQPTATGELVSLRLTDWQRSRVTHLDGVSRSATIGEVLGDAVRAMGLPAGTFYRAVVRGREVPRTETIEELGLETDSELEIAPKLAAG